MWLNLTFFHSLIRISIYALIRSRLIHKQLHNVHNLESDQIYCDITHDSLYTHTRWRSQGRILSNTIETMATHTIHTCIHTRTHPAYTCTHLQSDSLQRCLYLDLVFKLLEHWLSTSLQVCLQDHSKPRRVLRVVHLTLEVPEEIVTDLLVSQGPLEEKSCQSAVMIGLKL